MECKKFPAHSTESPAGKPPDLQDSSSDPLLTGQALLHFSGQKNLRGSSCLCPSLLPSADSSAHGLTAGVLGRSQLNAVDKG